MRRFYSKKMMAKERLSRLQKWILREAWKRLNSQHPKLRMDEIYIDFFKLPRHEDSPISESFCHIKLPNSKKSHSVQQPEKTMREGLSQN